MRNCAVNVLNFSKIRRFKFFLIWCFSLVTDKNKPTRVTNKTISTIDDIITSSIFNNDFKTAPKKADISYHFSITCAHKLRCFMSSENYQEDGYLYKSIVKESSKTAFKRWLRETLWDSVKGIDNSNESYIKYTETIMQIYDDCFLKTISK